jgi:hypothetical protein
MRVGLVALPLALVLLASSRSPAQPLQSFQDLALRVDLGDRLRIEDESGAATTGRLTRLTRDEIAIRTGDGEKRFTIAAVRTITVRRPARRRDVLIGAGVGAAVGALLACTGTDREECADGPILLGGVGAFVGLALSPLVARETTVYPLPTAMTPSRGSAQAPGPFDDLALRVDLGDRVRIEDLSGVRTAGRLTRLTGDEVTIETDAGERHFTSAVVREVAVRGYSLGRGALVGAVAFPVLLALSPGCRSDPDCVPIAAAPFGAGLGLAAGALIPRMTTIFRAQEPHATVSPVLSRGAIGIRASLRW